MNRVKDNILATLAYFDLFDHPLTRNELYLYLPQMVDKDFLDQELSYLVASQSVYRFGNFYTLQDNYQLAARRYIDTKTNNQFITDAAQLSELLIKIPYVQGIALSGSVFKADNHLLIITTKNRMWIARAFIYTLKTLGVLPKYYNPNFDHFIDESALEAKQKSFHTAMETLTLIPLQGDTVMEQFYIANTWVRHYLPNKTMRLSSAKPSRSYFFKSMLELVFNNPIANTIDNLLMMTSRLSGKGDVIDVAKHYAKPASASFKASVLVQYRDKMARMHIAPQNLLAN